MGIAGESSPASGAAHLVSHLLDMSADRQGRKLCYHGAQVSLGGILTAIAWDILLKEWDPAVLDMEQCFPSDQAMEPLVREAFAWLDDTGDAAAECWSDYRKKLAKWRSNRETFKVFLRNWNHFKEQVSAMLLPPEFICRCMLEAGAPTRFSRIDPPVDARTARWALLNCHLMRNRFTLVDLLFFTGQWNETFVERLLKQAETYDAGL
jgi:glycerol-1-phosphate dehydrogenase [NAD(P)+]